MRGCPIQPEVAVTDRQELGERKPVDVVSSPVLDLPLMVLLLLLLSVVEVALKNQDIADLVLQIHGL